MIYAPVSTSSNHSRSHNAQGSAAPRDKGKFAAGRAGQCLHSGAADLPMIAAVSLG
jgi:hypothetical protein